MVTVSRHITRLGTMRARHSMLPNMWPVMIDTVYLAAQLAKVALVCGGAYAFTYAIMLF